MTTTDQFVNLALKRYLSQNRFDANFFSYLQNISRDALAYIFPESGIFTYPITITPDYPSNDFTLTPTTIEGIDNAGRVFMLNGSDLIDIPYENTAGQNYWIGMKYIEVPNGLYINPRTGVPEYDKTEEQVGEKAEPNAVNDNGDGTITFTINSVCQSSVDCSGRIASVWLKNPISLDWTEAIENLAVVYAAPNNKITTVGALGQSTISTNTADYYVAIKGVSIQKNATNPYTSDYAIIGYITGGNPGSVSTADQRDLSGGGGHTLQNAYKGTGLGAGRVITVTDQAVLLNQENTSDQDKDIANAPLRIDKAIPTTLFPAGFDGEVCIDAKSRISKPGMAIFRVPLADYAGGDKLRVEEDVNLVGSSDQIDFTRGGSLDLTLTGNYGTILDSDTFDMIEVTGSSLGQNGLYWINTVSATHVHVTNLSNAAVSFSAESGLKARIYRANVVLGRENAACEINLTSDFLKDGGGAGDHQNAIYIDVPANANANDDIIEVKQDGGSTLFLLEADGDVTIKGNIISSSGNISASTGNIVATAGSITANVNLTATTGNIVATAGDIQAGSDVIVGSGEFKYNSSKSLWTMIPNALAQPDEETATIWVYSVSEYWVVNSTVGSNRYLHYPIKVPNGVTITDVQGVVYVANGSNPIYMNLYKYVHDFGTPAAPTQSALGSDNTGASTGNQLLSISSLTEVVNNETTTYFVTISAKTTTDKSYSIRVKYTFQNFRGN